MELLKDYVLLLDVVEHSKHSFSKVQRDYPHKRTIGKLSFVEKKDLCPHDSLNMKKFKDISNYFPSSELSMEIGQYKDFLSHQRIRFKKPIKILKIGKYTLVLLTEEFISLVTQGKQPFFIDVKKEENYEEIYKDSKIIDFYGMKIGFY